MKQIKNPVLFWNGLVMLFALFGFVSTFFNNTIRDILLLIALIGLILMFLMFLTSFFVKTGK